jgi:adenine phosphoribosyltransferase
MNLLDYLPGVPDFPKPGILFRDVSPLLADPAAFRQATQELSGLSAAYDCTHIAGIEARGFVFGAALALIRKPNKLPLATHRQAYGLEYGSDMLELQKSTLPAGARVLIIDDVLATGGTIVAAAKLIVSAGFQVCGAITLLEIGPLGGAALLEKNAIRFSTVLKI